MTRNRLADETSPYLLQHKDNPVHWWAWGPEALAEAKRTNRPILLSVGYAACHWCHVMAHDSFEDEATAALMNALFVNVKVDREERPDIDAIYMAALHSLGEHGGWPLTMFLTPNAEPFWGGTYFPPQARYGRPSFPQVLREIARLHAEERGKVMGNAAAIRSALEERRPAAEASAHVAPKSIADVALRLARATDPVHGGLSGAPKFPQYNVLWLMWQAGIRFDLPECRKAVLVTLRNICQGGIYDHVGGGFARYSVDERWLVPHFEKMLYDNALLLQLLTQAWRETREPLFAARVAETVGWLAGEMRTPGGAFASSYDADSEGEEGKFYLWSPAEVGAVLGPAEGELFCRAYDIAEGGNFEGRSIPNRLHDLDFVGDNTDKHLAGLAAKLYAHRKTRVPPGWDDKVLADWNGLAIAALAAAGQAFGRAEWIGLARDAFVFVRARMAERGRLRHSFRAGQWRGPGTASDYANMIAAAIALHEATGEAVYLDTARAWERTLAAHFWIAERGGYALTADDTADVIVRTQTAHDDATPNANAVMLANLVRLHALTADPSYLDRAEATLRAYLPEAAAQPMAHTGLWAGALELHAPMQVAIVGPAPNALQDTLRSLSLPGAVEQSIADTTQIPPASPLAGKTAIGGAPTAYVCVGGTCSAPVTDPEALRVALLSARRIA